jgi:hypothetical protein
LKLNRFLRVVVLVAGVGCLAKSGSAAPIVFSDRAAFQAAAGSTSTLTFDDLGTGAVASCLPSHPYVDDPCELDYGGATFVTTIGLPKDDQRPLLFALTSGLEPTNGLTSADVPLDPDDFFFTFQGNAVGLSLWSGSKAPVYIQVEDINGQLSNYSAMADAYVGSFFGVVSDVALHKVSLYTVPYTNEYGFEGVSNFGIDDVELQAVPEPSTLALMLGGAMALVRRRRRS